MLNHSHEHVVTFVQDVPVTCDRPPYNPLPKQELINPGTPRANLAPSAAVPHGTQEEDLADIHAHQTVLQQHCDFFDHDKDGVIWPLDTFRGFRALGFNLLLSLFAAFIIHASFSWITNDLVPDPFFRVRLSAIHKCKHGSDSNAYDNEGRFVPQKFEDLFAKYGEGKDCLTKQDICNALAGQRLLMDPFGWVGAVFEWTSLYLVLWPEDGMVRKEDVRRVYDGSLFYEIAELRQKGKGKMKTT
ncbi:Caleosin related protein-domain-containing protein [Amylocystis lapponica]|nr:Caleosin related protein-domain-containing protein [Amylocystis lapponica]